MAKEIIALRVRPGSGSTNIDVTWLFWLAVPAGQEIALPVGAASVWPGASAAENAAIQAGQVIEEQHGAQWPAGTPAATIKAALVSAFTARQAIVNGQPNPNQYFGVFFDSVTGWSA